MNSLENTVFLCVFEDRQLRVRKDGKFVAALNDEAEFWEDSMQALKSRIEARVRAEVNSKKVQVKIPVWLITKHRNTFYAVQAFFTGFNRSNGEIMLKLPDGMKVDPAYVELVFSKDKPQTAIKELCNSMNAQRELEMANAQTKKELAGFTPRSTYYSRRLTVEEANKQTARIAAQLGVELKYDEGI
jgi:hypothetical protein